MELGSEERSQWLPDVKIGDSARNALRMNWAGSVSYRLYVPPRAKFLAYIALMPDTRGRYHGPVGFRVQVIECGGDLKLNRQKLIEPSRFNRDPRWIKFSLELHRVANRQVQIILSTYLLDGSVLNSSGGMGGSCRLFSHFHGQPCWPRQKRPEVHGILGMAEESFFESVSPQYQSSSNHLRLPDSPVRAPSTAAGCNCADDGR